MRRHLLRSGRILLVGWILFQTYTAGAFTFIEWGVMDWPETEGDALGGDDGFMLIGTNNDQRVNAFDLGTISPGSVVDTHTIPGVFPIPITSSWSSWLLSLSHGSPLYIHEEVNGIATDIDWFKITATDNSKMVVWFLDHYSFDLPGVENYAFEFHSPGYTLHPDWQLRLLDAQQSQLGVLTGRGAVHADVIQGEELFLVVTDPTPDERFFQNYRIRIEAHHCESVETEIRTAGGKWDDFQGVESASGSSDLMAFGGEGLWRGFDDSAYSAKFGHTISNLPCGVVGATLSVRLKTTASLGSSNDLFGLEAQLGGSELAWSIDMQEALEILYGTGDVQEMGISWTDVPSTTFDYDLAALPMPDGSTTSILDSINQDRALDIFIEDNTAVDYMELRITSCSEFSGCPNGFSYVDSGQNLGSGWASGSYGVELGDFDRDGDLDAFVINLYAPNQIWLNDGHAGFVNSGQTPGTSASGYSRIAIGDLNQDTYLDAVVVRMYGLSEVWLNEGSVNPGVFVQSGQLFGSDWTYGVTMGDVDGNGTLDVVLADVSDGVHVWLNDGSGFLTMGTNFDDASAFVALGDLDGVEGLDAFVANLNFSSQSVLADHVWLNNGAGVFTKTTQELGNSASRLVSLGDLDGDGDLDAFVDDSLMSDDIDEIARTWMNDGAGHFSSGQILPVLDIRAVDLGDVDGDGDLDAVLGTLTGARVCLNNGVGIFTPLAALQDYGVFGVALGDLDGDNDLDAFFAIPSQPDEVWLNGCLEGEGVGCKSADLSITIVTDPYSVFPGESMMYELRVFNQGPDDATDVTVIDTLPPGVTPTGVVTNHLTSLGAGFGVSIPIIVTVNAGVSNLLNTVVVTANEPDLNPANNTDSLSTRVLDQSDCDDDPVTQTTLDGAKDNFLGSEPAYRGPGLDALVRPWTGFDDPSIDLHFGHTITDLPSLILGATLTVRLKSNGSSLSRNDEIYLETTGGSPSFAWGRRIGTADGVEGLLATSWSPGEVATLVLDLDALPLAGGGVISILDQIESDRALDVYVQDDTSVDYVELEVLYCEGLADLAISGSGPGVAELGTNFTYTITVTNQGPADAVDVVVTDELPPELGFFSPDFPLRYRLFSVLRHAMTFSLGTLASGETRVITTHGTTLAEGTLYSRFTVEANSADPNTADNVFVMETEVVADLGSPRVSILMPADWTVYTEPASVPINVEAYDSDGTITQVLLYAGETLLGTFVNTPYSQTWSDVPEGIYTLTARAMDNDAKTTTSTPVRIIVRSSDCNGDGTLDTAEILANPDKDCDGNGILDECDLIELNPDFLTLSITADNSYTLYAGTDAAATLMVGGDQNRLAGDIFHAESYLIDPGAYPFLYVSAWSDDATAQGLLVEIAWRSRLFGGGSAWRVYAVGTDLDIGSSPPTLQEMTGHILAANASTGDPATTSVGWVVPVIGENNGSSSYSCWGQVRDISTHAKWMWYQSGDEESPEIRSPFLRGFDHREFLIFRIPMSLASPDCDGNGVLDVCEIANDASKDYNDNGLLDLCEGNLVLRLICPPVVTLAAPPECCAPDPECCASTTISPLALNAYGNVTVLNDYNTQVGALSDCFPFGTNTVEFTATDEAGHTASCSVQVIVEDQTVPQILSCPDTQSGGGAP